MMLACPEIFNYRQDKLTQFNLILIKNKGKKQWNNKLVTRSFSVRNEAS